MIRNSDLTDEDLMAAAAGGARDAVDQLYRRYGAVLRAYFRRFESHDAAADDLVHDTFVRVIRYGASYDPDRSFRGWLFAIARNVGLLSRPVGPHAASLDDAVITATDDPVREYRRREALLALKTALEELSEAERRVIMLAKIEGRSYSDIGSMLGITEGAVKVRVFRALQRLREKLHEKDNPGGWLHEY